MKNKTIINKSFQERVWVLTKKIPRGKVATYGLIARALKNPRAVRAVGNALNKNPYAPIVPCHRVIRSNGQVGGFAGGNKKKENLLKKEGINIINHKIKFLNKILYKF